MKLIPLVLIVSSLSGSVPRSQYTFKYETPTKKYYTGLVKHSLEYHDSRHAVAPAPKQPVKSPGMQSVWLRNEPQSD